MVTKWGEKVESKREGHLVCNKGAITNLTSLASNVLVIKRSYLSSVKRIFVNFDRESLILFSASFSFLLSKCSKGVYILKVSLNGSLPYKGGNSASD